jgi:hypothetical protein
VTAVMAALAAAQQRAVNVRATTAARNRCV